MFINHTPNVRPIGIRADSPTERTFETNAYPQGEARKCNQMAFDNWAEHLVLSSEVRNMVIKSNSNVYSPFKLITGKPSPLGLFAESPFDYCPDAIPSGKQIFECHFRHDRSAILCRITFQDNEGRIYRDVDLKGIGLVSPDNMEMRRNLIVNVSNPGKRLEEGNYEGLLSRRIALHDYEMTEEFVRMGIGTCRVLGIIELYEIIASRQPREQKVWTPAILSLEELPELYKKYRTWAPEKLSLKEASEAGIIRKNFHPVIEVRAFLTKSRVSDIFNHSVSDFTDAHGQLMLEDAMKLASEGLGLKEPMSKTAYLEWFSRELGRNIGLMHRNGWEHHYLYDGHNTTLDGRIVDLDGVRLIDSEKSRQDELGCVEYAMLPRFCQTVLGVKDRSDNEVLRFVDMFLESYKKSFNNQHTT